MKGRDGPVPSPRAVGDVRDLAAAAGSGDRRRTRTAESTQAARSAAARAALLDAARKLFVARGYSATSVTDIVAAAGTSVGLLYYHFGNKEQIFIALWNEYQAKQEQATRHAVAEMRAAGERDGARLLLGGMRAFLRGGWEQRDLMPILHGYDRPPKFHETSTATLHKWLQRNRTLLTGHDQLLTGHDQLMVDIASSMVTDSLSGLLKAVAAAKDEAEADAIAESGVALAALMLEGLKGAGVSPAAGPARRA
jgi:AcrR family transcriptional regulator